VVVNLLPVPGLATAAVVARVATGHRRARLLTFDGYQNRVVVAGARVPPARALGQTLRGALVGIGSRLARDLRVRTVR
jgi:hypothetical protein